LGVVYKLTTSPRFPTRRLSSRSNVQTAPSWPSPKRLNKLKDALLASIIGAKKVTKNVSGPSITAMPV